MARILADLTDLLHYFRINRLPFGVPRVQMALAEAAMLGPEPPLLEPMAFEPVSGRFRPLPAQELRALLATARQGADTAAPDWLAARATLAGAHQAAPVMEFAAGDRVFTPGQPFQVPGQMRRLRELRQAHGVALCALFYDAIPLVVPEHCTPELSTGFAENLLSLCLQTDRVVAISACAARDFRTWQRRLLPGLEIPVATMPLDAPLPPLGDGAPPPWPEALSNGLPYVLCVSTLESRKNHVLLLHAWLTLLRRHGEHAVPRLVLVGREGFGAEAARRLLDRAPELRRNVLWLPGVGDALLARLYEGCLFTVFNSFYEGWGLPVTEALSHGKLVLAPDHSSLREAGGAAALYFTPQSEPELADLAWGLIRDPARRAALEAALPARIRLRGWREVAEGLARDLAAPLPALPDPFTRAGPVAGRRVGFDIQPPLPAAEMRFAHVGNALMLEGEGWSVPETYGVWLTPGAARLRLPGLPGQAMRLFLEVTGAPEPSSVGLRLQPPGGAAGEWRALRLAPGERRHLEFTLPAGPAGEVVVEFDGTAARPAPGDDRRLALMLHGMMLCADHDLQRAYEYLGDRLHLQRLG